MNPLQVVIVVALVWFLIDYWWAWLSAPLSEVDVVATPSRPVQSFVPKSRVTQSASDRLEGLQPGSRVGWDGNLHVLSAHNHLHALTQLRSDAPWTRTGVVSSVLEFDGGTTFLLCIPHAENGRLVWLEAWCVAKESLGAFYKNGENGVEGSGPASVFRKSKQQTPVSYVMPKNIMPGEKWKVVDIGSFSVDPRGNSATMLNGDQLFSVTSKSNLGRYAFYLDARPPNAKGSCLLFIGKLIDSETLQL